MGANFGDIFHTAPGRRLDKNSDQSTFPRASLPRRLSHFFVGHRNHKYSQYDRSKRQKTASQQSGFLLRTHHPNKAKQQSLSIYLFRSRSLCHEDRFCGRRRCRRGASPARCCRGTNLLRSSRCLCPIECRPVRVSHERPLDDHIRRFVSGNQVAGGFACFVAADLISIGRCSSS
jgi:hypothetical protein